MEYAFVTGATGVLGAAFCRELANRGYGLFITGRNADKLEILKTSLIETYPGINCCYAPADLSDSSQREKVYAAAKDYNFSIIVNVAGADIQKAFIKYDEKKLVFQTRACFESAVSVCNFALSHRAERLHIINISSICGNQPMPYFAVYSACKGALTDFSVALSRELRGSGITVTAVLPGSIYTRKDVCEYIDSLGFWAKKAAKSPEFVVSDSLKAAFKGKVKCIPGGLNKMVYFFSKMIPEKLKLRYAAVKYY